MYSRDVVCTIGVKTRKRRRNEIIFQQFFLEVLSLVLLTQKYGSDFSATNIGLCLIYTAFSTLNMGYGYERSESTYGSFKRVLTIVGSQWVEIKLFTFSVT